MLTCGGVSCSLLMKESPSFRLHPKCFASSPCSCTDTTDGSCAACEKPHVSSTWLPMPHSRTRARHCKCASSLSCATSAAPACHAAEQTLPATRLFFQYERGLS